MEQLAELLNVPLGKANDLLYQKGFPSSKVGKCRVVPKAAFVEWVLRHAGEHSDAPRQVIASVPENLKFDALPIFMRPSTVSDLLGISQTSSTSLFKESGCPSIRIGTRLVVPKGEFFLWLLDNPKYDENQRYQVRDRTKPKMAALVRSGKVNLDGLPPKFTVKAMRELFGISKSTAYDLIRNKSFPKIQERGCQYVLRDAFLEWLLADEAEKGRD